MGVGIDLIVASVLYFSVTLILAVIAYEVWDSGCVILLISLLVRFVES